MSTQLTFAELRRSRATDPQTSQDAARRANGLAAAHRQAILATMQRGGSWTAHEVAENCGLTSVQVNRRFAELRDDGAIEGGSEGGKARAAALTSEQRKEIARISADARWRKS